MHRHTYHLVNPSPWPISTAFSAFIMIIGGVLYMHSFAKGGFFFLLGISLLLTSMGLWWRDVVRESTYEGNHTKAVKTGLRYGMLIFIISEVMFFFSFFWAFFHSSLSPVIEIGSVWPPENMKELVFDSSRIPLLNTLILLLSGATLTWCHYAILSSNKKDATISLFITLFLAALFTTIQGYEYVSAPFSISDGVYGSTFYLATGFHGLHVIIGSLFLMVCFYRLVNNHFTVRSHIGFEAAAWYWHFVDVVWLFLYISTYCWGGIPSPELEVTNFICVK
uniref:Cytochrome c oxidase subunit 3 n=1 Tax=Cyanophora biloba TaxID=1489483 RepID=A0A873WYB0_9EUKA|nr:cytochrome c oxidase subunit 3 [Cyanophora biloba]QPB15011.1 cytochrome c oxidase subunit 3 [Cyanophora biloba]